MFNQTPEELRRLAEHLRKTAHLMEQAALVSEKAAAVQESKLLKEAILDVIGRESLDVKNKILKALHELRLSRRDDQKKKDEAEGDQPTP